MPYLDALGNPVSPGDHVVLLRPSMPQFVRRVGRVVRCENGQLLVGDDPSKPRFHWGAWAKPCDVQLTSSPVYGETAAR